MSSRGRRQRVVRVASLVGVAVLAVGTADARAETHVAKQAVSGLPAQLLGALDRGAATMDVPIELIRIAKKRLSQVKDYTALLLREERLRGRMTPLNYIRLKLRHEPFSVYMKWVRPGPSAGREVLYVEGQNADKVIIHDSGLLGLFVKKVAFAVNDPIIRAKSLYPITHTGLKSMATRMDHVWTQERGYNETVVTTSGDAKANDRPAWFVKLQRPKDVKTASREFGGKHVYYKVHCWVDKELLATTRFEAYNWPSTNKRPSWDLLKILPTKKGPEDGALICRYTYKDVQFDVGLTDKDFDWRNPAYRFR